MEIEQLTDALGMDKIHFSSFDDDTRTDATSSGDGGGETPCYNTAIITDPVDVELMASSKYVVFENIGAGLDDDRPVLTRKKKKSPLKVRYSSCLSSPTKTSQTKVTARSKSYKKKKITKRKGTNILKSSLERKGSDRMTSNAETNRSVTRIASITSNSSVTSREISIMIDHNEANSEQKSNSSRDSVFVDLPSAINFIQGENISSSSIGNAVDVKNDLPPFPADIPMSNNKIDNTINTLSYRFEFDKKEQPLSETNNDSSSMDTDSVDIKFDFPELSMDCHGKDSIAAATRDTAMNSFIRSLMVGDDESNLIPSSYGS